jgi:hypothetical protein
MNLGLGEILAVLALIGGAVATFTGNVMAAGIGVVLLAIGVLVA